MFGNLSAMGLRGGFSLDPKKIQQYVDSTPAGKERIRKEEAERQRIASLADKGRKQITTYRDSYDAGEPTSFAEAKQAADETYLQYWYDKANDVTKNWTDRDYALIVEPEYEEVRGHRGRTKQVRILPEGYDEYKEYQDRISAGPLDFSSEETHKMLINPPSNRGYGKRQSWISKDDPLRQAVEAQADVMKDFLDDAGVPIVQKYEDLEGFDRPDSFRGEGIYLNTGTAAHIDWDADLKRMQQYQSSPDAELGTYSQVFVRPDPEGIAKPLAFVGSITGNPWLTAASAVAAGGDLEDALKGAAKGYVIGQVTAPILENTVANLGIDKDLFGMDAEAFSEGMMDVQTTILEGGDIDKALIKEFGVPAIKQLGSALSDVDIDLPESKLLSTIGDALEPVVGAVRAGARAFDDAVLQPINENIVKPLEQAGRDFDDKFLEPWTEPTGEFLSDAEDKLKDLGRTIDDIVDFGALAEGMLGGSQGQQRTASTPTEDLFDKELFKFDTEIKSTQEMLSPMMNLRKYG